MLDRVLALKLIEDVSAENMFATESAATLDRVRAVQLMFDASDVIFARDTV